MNLLLQPPLLFAMNITVFFTTKLTGLFGPDIIKDKAKLFIDFDEIKTIFRKLNNEK